MQMQTNYFEQKLFSLNKNLVDQFEKAFQKDKHRSSKFIGERKIKSKVGSRVSFFPSKKNQGTISLESNLELAHAIELERDQDVVKYQTQAIKIFIDESHFIIPDFIVKKLDSYEVHEIKPNIKALSLHNINRFKAAENILNLHNIGFKLFDEKDLIDPNNLIILKSSYQRIYNINIPIESINNYSVLILNKKYKNRHELIDCIKRHEVPDYMADYFIFYNKILGV